MTKIKIALDARWSIGEYRGMGRFTRFFIKPIEKNIIAFGSKGQQDKILNVISKGINFYPLWEQLTLPKLCNENDIDLLICPYNTAPVFGNLKKMTVLIVHDIIFMKSIKELPISNSFYQNLGRIYRKLVLPLVIKKANYLITVSNYSKVEIIKRFGIEGKKIIVIPNTIDKKWFEQPQIPTDKRKPYIFCVTGEGASKNFFNGLKAYIHLIKTNPNVTEKLIVAGIKVKDRTEYLQLATKESVSKRIIFLDFISDELLVEYYQNARLFFFPSLYEGFGIPLIEAMALGTPIACSNTTSFPEVTNNAALYFDPTDILSISATIQKLINNPALCRSLQAKGVVEVQRYHPDRVLNQISDFWRNFPI